MAANASIISDFSGGSTVVEDGSYGGLEDIPIRDDTFPPGVAAILGGPTLAGREAHEHLTTAAGAWVRPRLAVSPTTPATQRSWFAGSFATLTRVWRRLVGAQVPAPTSDDLELGPLDPTVLPHGTDDTAPDTAPDTRPQSGTSSRRSDGSIAELLQHALEPYLTHERAVTFMKTWLGGFILVILRYLVYPLIMDFIDDGVPPSMWLPLASVVAALVAGVVLALVLRLPFHSFVLILLLCISTLVGLLHRAKS